MARPRSEAVSRPHAGGSDDSLLLGANFGGRAISGSQFAWPADFRGLRKGTTTCFGAGVTARVGLRCDSFRVIAPHGVFLVATEVRPGDRLLDSPRRCRRSRPGRRRGRNTTADRADRALAAFAPFFMPGRSLRAHQHHRETGQGRPSCQTPFAMRVIPGDSQIRAKLDAIEPEMFHPMFADLVVEPAQRGGLDAMRCPGGHVLLALDGTELHCPNGSHRERGKDKTE